MYDTTGHSRPVPNWFACSYCVSNVFGTGGAIAGLTSTTTRYPSPPHIHDDKHDDMRGEFGDGDGAIAKPGPSRAGLLPTTGSWQSLPRHTRMLLDDAMEHVDEDHGAASKSAPTYDQARSATDAAPVRASAPNSTKKLNKAAAKLNKAAVLAIFQTKPCKGGRRSSLSAALGRRYGTTAKAVRDVWNGRTWAHVTKPFWTAEEKNKYEEKKKYKVRTMQACSGHPTPYPTPITLAMHLSCAYSLWSPRVDRA